MSADEVLIEAREFMLTHEFCSWEDYEIFKNKVGWVRNYDDFIQKLIEILGL